jgi:hypothetical protein
MQVYRAQHGSTTALEHILSYDGCDVDLQNRLEHDTPLHSAMKNLEDPEHRNHVVESLLEAGANTKYVLDCSRSTGPKIRMLMSLL